MTRPPVTLSAANLSAVKPSAVKLSPPMPFIRVAILTLVLALFAALASPTPATADTPAPPLSPPSPIPPTPTLDVRLGWGGLYRPGEWTPVAITLPPSADPTPAQGTLEIHAWQDARSSVIVSLPVPLQASSRGRSAEWVVPAVMGGSVDGTSFLLRDAAGKVLAATTATSLTGSGIAGPGGAGPGSVGAVPLTTNTRLVAVASPLADGNSASPTPAGDFISAPIDLRRLPAIPELYESLDALVLTGTTLDDLDAPRQNAIIAYVRAGGRLLLCPPPEGWNPAAPLAQLLPADPGELTVYRPGGAPLAGRALRPRPGATQVLLSPDTTDRPSDPRPLAFIAPAGLGHVMVSPVPLTPASRKLVGSLLATAIEAKPRVVLDWPRVPAPADNASFAIGVSPQTPAPFQFPWRPLALALLTLGLLLGPVEAVVRRAHGRWPWRWWVCTGLLLSAIAAGSLLLAPTSTLTPTLTVRPATLIDQAGSDVVAVTQLLPPSALSQAAPGLPRLFEPLRVTGTDHSAVVFACEPGPAVRLLPAHPAWAIALRHQLTSQPPTASGPLTITPAGPNIFTLTPPPPPHTRLWLETAGRLVELKTTPADPTAWSAPPPPDPPGLPDDIAQLRRLTPARSAALQAAVNRQTHDILWILRPDSVYIRATIDRTQAP